MSTTVRVTLSVIVEIEETSDNEQLLLAAEYAALDQIRDDPSNREVVCIEILS